MGPSVNFPIRVWCLGVLLAAVAPTCLSEAGNHTTSKEFPGIRKLMKAAEFDAAGLSKLSPEELVALDGWLLRYTAGEAEMLQRSNEQVRAAAEEVRIVSRLQTPFEGWDGNTLFRLENGQVWKQRQPGRYRYVGNDLEVTIRRNVFGFHVLTVNSTGRSVGVEFVR